MRRQAGRTSGVLPLSLLEPPAETTQADLEQKIRELNQDPAVTGIILQMPLPKGLDPRAAQAAIAPEKDVEGILPQNLGLVAAGRPGLAPCTALGAFELICSLPLEPKKEIEDWVEEDIRRRNLVRKLYGHHVVVVGHSEIVGKPLSLMLLNNYCTVTTCHVGTVDLAAHTRRAEVLFVATGVSQARWLGYKRRKRKDPSTPLPDLSPLIKADMLRPGAIVIDVAINRIPKGFDEAGEPLKNEKGRNAMITVGDVDFEAAKEKVAAITPVPGGVGPVTVAMLLSNTIACAKATT